MKCTKQGRCGWKAQPKNEELRSILRGPARASRQSVVAMLVAVWKHRRGAGRPIGALGGSAGVTAGMQGEKAELADQGA